MYSKSHRLVTHKAFKILRGIGDSAYPFLAYEHVVAYHAWKTDDYRDLEFVDVEGGGGIFGDTARDNPHTDEGFWVNDDDPHYEYDGRNFTAFNHFIDIKKGRGIFDDYDGYSYKRGSASGAEYQDASSVTSGWAKVFAWISGKKVDEGINWWFNDEYAHAPGHKWYRRGKCSPALERYSFPEDKGRYRRVEDECRARFPMAEATGQRNRGIPWSVFMPVDNMARYWYSEFLKTNNPAYLGSVMHAIQDASIPHHAAGYSGNWHTDYERDLESNILRWLLDARFTDIVKRLFRRWNRVDNSPPSHLDVNDWSKIPAINWRVDQLVTWVALNAYKEYSNTYNHFKHGYSFNGYSASALVKIATAMSLLVLKKAAAHLQPMGDLISIGWYRQSFIRHRNFRGEVTPIVSTLDQKDATFKIVPGLADDSCVSFESLNYPGYYLRHQNFQIKLHKKTGDWLFKKDATFKVVPGLNDNRQVSFESLNYPGYFIYNNGNILDLKYLSYWSWPTYILVTFKIVEPKWTPPLAAPTQISPLNNSTFYHYPRRTVLKWEPVPRAASYTVEVEYKYGNIWSLSRRKSDIKATSYVFNFVGAQPGRWRVWAVGADGKASAKSGWWEFRYRR
ncbi:MAG: AbfB domain-containing protein [Euryarchaeota archaeon]|uniref:Uncharacterized protein n=1 Tax=Candidatus Methanogaster sp. TaxID=3386292 RepID=A0AC61L213_9EURY|nr:AbfB domain-containing protein [Euryarchaeota archaeon]PXF60486.1 MAG: hypothetical protein C4B59_09445 [ANME-2 cluster archaeon]